MNKNLIQLNNNFGVVSDENGNIDFIEKENDSHSFEEILLKENNLEDLKSKLENYKNKLSLNKEKMIFGEIASGIFIGTAIILFSFLYSMLSLKSLIILLALTYFPFKVMSILMYGTRIERHIKKNKLTNDIEEMKLLLSKLEEELTEMKEKSKYKVSVSHNDKSKTPTIELSSEMALESNSSILNEHSKARVLSLSRKK